jgi:hypothetical protein
MGGAEVILFENLERRRERRIIKGSGPIERMPLEKASDARTRMSLRPEPEHRSNPDL